MRDDLYSDVPVDLVIERLETHRANHRAAFETAMRGYAKAAIEAFEARIERVKAGKRFNTLFNLPEPSDHTEDYERVLDMVRLHKGETIRLSSQDFRRYMRDEWDWKGQFETTASNYR